MVVLSFFVNGLVRSVVNFYQGRVEQSEYGGAKLVTWNLYFYAKN